MRKFLGYYLLALATCWFVTSRVAFAHDLVFIPEGSSALVIKFGHPGRYEPPDPHKLIKLQAYSPAGSEPTSLLDSVEPGSGVLAAKRPEKAAIVIGEYDNGYWVGSAGKRYLNTSKINFPTASDSGSNFKYAKVLIWVPNTAVSFSHPIGEGLELVPQSDPFTLKSGQSLSVLLLYQGKPLPAVGLEIGDGKTPMKEEDIPRYKTNGDGVAVVPIARQGLQVIAVDYQTAPRHPDLGDHDNYGATLTFVLR